MTGGTTLPTPNIEANEALSLTFYLHDCYHLEIDSAIGQDRVFWNAFGKHLLKCAKETNKKNMKISFQTLAEFCLDKEFNSYKLMPKNQAFIVPLLGLFSVAGKKPTDDQQDPFKMIKDESFVKKVQKELLHHFQTFWKTQVSQLELREDLTIEAIINSLKPVKQILAMQGEQFPKFLEDNIRAIGKI